MFFKEWGQFSDAFIGAYAAVNVHILKAKILVVFYQNVCHFDKTIIEKDN